MSIRRRLKKFFLFFGLDPLLGIHNIRRVFKFYLPNLRELKKQIKANASDLEISSLFPCLYDIDHQSGSFGNDYFYQDILVAQKVYANNPARHLDIGSRVDGFVAHVATFREIDVLDIRPLDCLIPNIRFKQIDLMKPIDNVSNCYDSISCLHALEHFGLGRYGDSIDIFGSEKGFNNIFRLLSKGGKLYFSVPIGRQRIEFNAHRIFGLKYLLNMFENKYKIISFSYVNDEGMLFRDKEITQDMIDNDCYCEYGCGIFELEKM